MTPEEMEERARQELEKLLFPDPAKREMEVAVAKGEMLAFIDGLSDDQLNTITRMIGMHRGQDRETWRDGMQQWAGMMYLEQMRRNAAKAFAELPKPTDGLPGGTFNADVS